MLEATSDDEPFRRLLHDWQPRSRLLRTWPLTGGVSARITALEVADERGSITRSVVREHGEVDRAGNPDIARDEFRLLEIAAAGGIACPAAQYLDVSCRHFANPVLVIGFLAGEPEFEPDDLEGLIVGAADVLARIHAVPADERLAFLPRREAGVGPAPAAPDDTLQETRIRNALGANPLGAPRNSSTLLHGDFWPGNLLWDDGRLSGVIDWEDAHTGDPLADLGNAIFEFSVAFGAPAALSFTTAYLARRGLDTHDLAYWQLAAALRMCGKLADWGLPEEDEARIRAGHAAFVEDALARLGAAERRRT